MKKFILLAVILYCTVAAGEAAESHGPLISRDDIKLCSVLKNPEVYTGKRKIMKFLIQGKDGWIFRSVDFRTDFGFSPSTENYFKRLTEALAKKNIKLVMVVQPPRAMTEKIHIDPQAMPPGYDAEKARENFRALLKTLEGYGITTIDLSNIPADLQYFATGDPHWDRTGARYSAQKTADIIKTFPEYAQMPKKEFVIEAVGSQDHEKGSFEEFAEQVCHVTIPPVQRTVWATTEKEVQVSEAGLLGDVAAPDITVVGTSNSAHDDIYNFVGSLKQFLSVDVDNEALPAGAFGGASALYYASDIFHQSPPKLIVWEVLAHHDFDDPDMFRQMIPAVNGPCGENDAIVNSSLNIMNSEITIFDGLEKQKIDPQHSYLYLEITNPEKRSLKVGVLYANGGADETDITRSDRGGNNGKYYLEFNPDIRETPIMIQIDTDKPQGAIKARICASSP